MNPHAEHVLVAIQIDADDHIGGFGADSLGVERDDLVLDALYIRLMFPDDDRIEFAPKVSRDSNLLLTVLATLIFVPSMPFEERLSYGTQLSVLKKSITWLSIVTVILLNSAVFGVYSYFADYLKTVTNMSPNTISLTLFIFGGANIIGNLVAGKLLTHSAMKSVVTFPLLLGVVYIILFFTGQFTVPMVMITLVWGILAGGIMANINQYLIASAAPEAPDFANGLFISSCKVGRNNIGCSCRRTIYIRNGYTIVLRNNMITPTRNFLDKVIEIGTIHSKANDEKGVI